MPHKYSKNWSRSWRISQEVSRSLKLNATEFTDSENFKFSIWKSGICHFRSLVTHHGWNRILRTAHFTEWLLCVNTAYPDGLRFYDFQILSSGFLVKIFSRATSSPHLASVHMLTKRMATRVPRAQTGLFVDIPLWIMCPRNSDCHNHDQWRITALSLSKVYQLRFRQIQFS